MLHCRAQGLLRVSSSRLQLWIDFLPSPISSSGPQQSPAAAAPAPGAASAPALVFPSTTPFPSSHRRPPGAAGPPRGDRVMGTAGASLRLAVHGAAYVLRSAPCLLFICFLRVNLCFHRCPSVSFSSALPSSRHTPVQRRVPIPSIPRCRRTGRHFASFPCCPTAARSSWHFGGLLLWMRPRG